MTSKYNIHAGAPGRKPSIRVKICDFLSRVTLKFDRWTWEKIRHLFYTTLSFVHHFIGIGEVKLITVRKSWCDLEIEFITLKNNRAPLLYSFKLCASFYSHHWIQTGVSARKRPIWVNNDYVLFCVSSNLDRWLWKTTGHLFCATSSFVHNFVAIDEFKLEVQSGNTQLGPKSTIFCLDFLS